jgi:two-component system phosphate regulon sensor histidine kinase PhoR
MTPGKIKTIVFLMCLSMIALIAFQWYWIREALAIQNDRFNDKVAEVVQRVAHKLEKQEIVYLIQRRREDEIQKEKLRQITLLARKKGGRQFQEDSVPKPKQTNSWAHRMGTVEENIPIPHRNRGLKSDALVPSFHQFLEREQQWIDDFFRSRQMGASGIEDFIRSRMNDDLIWGEFFDSRLPQELSSGLRRDPRSRQDIQNPIAAQRSARSEKSPSIPTSTDAESLLREVIEDIVYTKRPLQERFDRFLMDSLLRDEFVQNGIDLPFSFAVRPFNQPDLLFSTANVSREDWEQNSYQTTIFQGVIPHAGGLLFVYFPGKKQYVLEKTAAMMTGSVVLVIVLMVCFYLAVTTILRQKKLSEIKNDFINNMTHELKTPISTIGLAVDMATEKVSNLGEERQGSGLTRYMDIIGTENKRLGAQVERVLQMAQLDRGNLKLNREVVHVHDMIEKALKSLSVQIENRGGELVLDYLASDDRVSGDSVHLTNVLYNLIDNAIKYSPEVLRLEIKTESIDGGIAISVADLGIGLSKDEISRIFDRFYRVPTGNLHDVKGFGLGLSYVKKVVNEHKGSVSVVSKKGQGSTFSVWLPLYQSVM